MQLRVASLVMSAGADAPRRAGDAACETGRLASFAFALLSEMTVTRLLAEMDARMHARDFEECENVALCVFYMADTQEPRAAAAQCLAALHNLLFADFHAARVFYEMALLHMPAVGEHVDAGINADRIKVLVQYGRMLERRLRLHTDALRCPRPVSVHQRHRRHGCHPRCTHPRAPTRPACHCCEHTGRDVATYARRSVAIKATSAEILNQAPTSIALWWD